MPVKVYDGTNWVTVAGDGAAGAPGTNGTNGIDASPFAAGKNKIINGDFTINQRGFTSTTTTGTFMFDRFNASNLDGTCTYSAQTFTAGTAPVTGYEATNFIRLVSTGQTAANAEMKLQHKIESVRTLANQTATISFWAKASTGTPSVAVELLQNFGSGGSTSVTGIGAAKSAITSSWARYSFTASVPSISGKTLGAGNFLSLNIYTSAGTDFNARTNSLGIQSVTIDLWGIQVEAAQTASNFQTATGTLQGELAACQRYYFRFAGGQTFSRYGTGYSSNTNTAFFNLPLPVSMRVSPTAVDYSTLILDNGFGTSAAVTAVTLTANCQSPTVGSIGVNVASGLTADRNYQIENNGSTAGYIGFTAEL